MEAAVLAGGMVWYLALLCRGLSLPDEGSQYLHGWQIFRGLVTYRDYFVPVAPLGYLIQAGLIKVFGFQVLVGRLYLLLQGVVLLLVAMSLGRRHLRYPFSLVPPIFFIPCSIPLAAFPHYNVDGAFFLALTLFFLDNHLRSSRGRDIFLAGLFAAASAWTKQSLAAAAGPLLLLGLFRKWRRGQKNFRDLLLALAGILLLSLPIMVWLVRNHAAEETWACLSGMSDMKRLTVFSLLPFSGFLLVVGLLLVRGLIHLTTAKKPGGGRLEKAGAWLWSAAVLIPLALLLRFPSPAGGAYLCGLLTVSLLLFPKSPREEAAAWSLIRAYALLFFLATVLSGFDLGHLFLAAMGAPYFAGLLLQNLREKTGPSRHLFAVAAGTGGLLFLTGLYLDLSLPHFAYADLEPRWRSTAKVNLPGLAGIRAHPDKARDVEQTVRWVASHTTPQDKIFVYPWQVFLYVLCDRLPATYHTYLYYEIFDQNVLNRIIHDLETNRPSVAIAAMKGNRMEHVTLEPQAKIMETYLLSRYTPVARFGRFQIMVRKDHAESGAGRPAEDSP